MEAAIHAGDGRWTASGRHACGHLLELHVWIIDMVAQIVVLLALLVVVARANVEAGIEMSTLLARYWTRAMHSRMLVIAYYSVRSRKSYSKTLTH